jgi:hypothetical protein
MIFKYSDTPRVSYEEAKTRVLDYLRAHQTTRPPSMIAHAIWPDHKMRPQGAAFAASAILFRMKEEGLVYWTSEETSGGHRLGWGWKLR